MLEEMGHIELGQDARTDFMLKAASDFWSHVSPDRNGVRSMKRSALVIKSILAICTASLVLSKTLSLSRLAVDEAEVGLQVWLSYTTHNKGFIYVASAS